MQKKTSITDEIINKFISANLESSKKIEFEDLFNQKDLEIALYKDLPQTTIKGYPVASDYIDKDGKSYSTNTFNKLSDEEKSSCDLRYFYLPYSHEIYIGGTGSGKTTGSVEPQLRAISYQKNKPNLFISDPKGELFERNSKHLKDQGYKIYILNFKDLSHSDCWNPLLDLYDKNIKLNSLGKNVKMHMGPIKPTLTTLSAPEEFKNNCYIEYDGKAFPDGEKCEYYINFQKDTISADIDSLVNQFASNIIKIQSKVDASWDYGSLQLLRGILFCMLEDSIDPNSGFTRDMMTIKTIQEYYIRFRADLAREDCEYTFEDYPLLTGKTQRTLTQLRTALHNSARTMLSYCGVFDGHTKDWFQGHIFALTSNNTIDLNNSEKQPYAVFIATRDYEKSDFTVAGMFIDWVYKNALENAEKAGVDHSGKPKTRPLHFLLDEFGNIPEIKDFENKIATARSRNIWFHLIVQSYEQINIVYDKDNSKKSEVIFDNCNSQVFLGTQSQNTKRHFSDLCGNHSIASLNSVLKAEDNSLITTPVIPLSELDLIETGQIYIKRIYTPVIKAQYIRSYICAKNGTYKNYYDTDAFNKYAPNNIISFNSPKYTFKKLHEKFKKSRFGCL